MGEPNAGLCRILALAVYQYPSPLDSDLGEVYCRCEIYLVIAGFGQFVYIHR